MRASSDWQGSSRIFTPSYSLSCREANQMRVICRPTAGENALQDTGKTVDFYYPGGHLKQDLTFGQFHDAGRLFGEDDAHGVALKFDLGYPPKLVSPSALVTQ